MASAEELTGAKKEIFSSDALAMLHEATSGHLRNVDRVATAALKRAARRKLKLIDRGVIQDVLADQAPAN